MLTYVYNLIITPLVLVVELIYTIMSRLIGNVGLSIIAVSVVVSTLILPLYRRADAVQEAERNKQADMEHWVNHIKKTFKGDEQYMMLTTYYRQMDYHPLYSLRSSVSLLLQIPFFIAAYRFLSGLNALHGIPFGPIADLSAPDRMLTLGGMTVNLLPILMTVINLLSGAVYSRGLPLKMKLQQYGLTLLFLILLYNRPAGLVLYWTMNNVFSLVKNLITKVSRHPRRDTAVCAAALGLLFAYLAYPNITNRKGLAVMIGILALSMLPLAMLLVRKFIPAGEKVKEEPQKKVPRLLFILGGLVLTVLAGYLIPVSVISDSPAEFIEINAYVTPLRYVFYTLSVSAGFFLVWSNIFYSLATEKVKRVFTLGFWLCSITALVNYMFFGKNFGTLTTQLAFEDTVYYPAKAILLNLLVLAVLALIMYLIWKRLPGLISRIYVVVLAGMLILCISNTVSTQSYIKKIPGLKRASTAAADSEETQIEPIFSLSRNGKNVMVLMMDRMISGYLPYILHEKPELAKQFEGFTWYPNTLSYGRSTNFGSPALFGGYEYTPDEMNKRDTELLKDKQNELLKVMPVMFLQEGYDVTVCDPPYAGYEWISDLSIYDDYPEIKAYNILYMNEFTKDLDEKFAPVFLRLRYRNFFYFSVFRMVPKLFQPAVYDEGFYFTTETNNIFDDEFIPSYGALSHFPDMTKITDDAQNTFMMMDNRTAHEPTLLQMPDYEPELYVDNSMYFDESLYTIDGVTLKMKNDKHIAHYCINMAAMIKLGAYFDFLREQGVFDNTRIIIVADHGKRLGQFEGQRTDRYDIMCFNPMLMVKDFGASGEITRCDDFMTNADTPTLAVSGLIENPVNPFTGKEINNDEKTAHPQLVTNSKNWRTEINNGTTYDTGDGEWFAVKDNIFDTNNWELVKETEYVKE